MFQIGDRAYDMDGLGNVKIVSKTDEHYVVRQWGYPHKVDRISRNEEGVHLVKPWWPTHDENHELDYWN